MQVTVSFRSVLSAYPSIITKGFNMIALHKNIDRLGRYSNRDPHPVFVLCFKLILQIFDPDDHIVRADIVIDHSSVGLTSELCSHKKRSGSYVLWFTFIQFLHLTVD